MKRFIKMLIVILSSLGIFCFNIFSASNTSPTPTPADVRLASFALHMKLAKSSVFKNLKWQNVGPVFTGGRITDIAVCMGKTYTYYIAAASGGVWKTANNGTTWTPVFDNEGAYSIGDIAVAPSNPDILWVGTGESNSSRSSYSGTGVYKSVDGGKSWTFMGLKDSHHIGRIVIHPRNPDIVYVASIGHLYTPGGQKGVFRTTDGGKTWKAVLTFDDLPHTGAIDLVMDPKKPRVLYAAAWERHRRPWNFWEGGKGSGIYKTTDAGKTWKRLSGGFPSGDFVGRIGLAIAPSNHKIVYAIIDNQTPLPKKKNKLGFSVEDLKTMTPEQFLKLGKRKIAKFLRIHNVPRKIKASDVMRQVKSGEILPADIAKTLYDANAALVSSSVVGAQVYRSDDEGHTWHLMNQQPIHSFYNTYGYYFGNIRVDPKNPNRIFILGVPVMMSNDGGKHFKPLRYHGFHGDHHALWIDPANPQHIMDGNDGGLNVSYDGGKTWKKFNNIPIAQFYTLALDNDKPFNIYGGLQDNGVCKGSSAMDRRHSKQWEMILGGDGAYVQVDPTDSNIVYTEYQFGNMFRLNLKEEKIVNIKPFPKFGDLPYRFNWQTPIYLSPFNRYTLYVGANKLLKSVDQGEIWVEISPDLTTNPKQGDVPFGTITSIDISSFNPRRIYVGTDDGLVWTSPDDGGHWEKINKGLPQGKWVSRIVASKYFKGTVYVALTGYRDDDFNTYIYKSTDYGKSWFSIKGNLPDESVNVVREDPARCNILYLGTDCGIYASLDGGKSWMSLRCNLPTVAVHDLMVHPRDKKLVIATHGRSVYIMDAGIIEKTTKEILAKAIYIYPVEPIYLPDISWFGDSATFFFYLKENPKKLTAQVLNQKGIVVKNFKVKNVGGINQILWNLRTDKNKQQEAPEMVKPGPYILKIEADGKVESLKFEILPPKNPVDYNPES